MSSKTVCVITGGGSGMELEAAFYRPKMCKTIKKTLLKIDLSIYKESMLLFSYSRYKR